MFFIGLGCTGIRGGAESRAYTEQAGTIDGGVLKEVSAGTAHAILQESEIKNNWSYLGNP
jgi:hypothetical protein